MGPSSYWLAAQAAGLAATQEPADDGGGDGHTDDQNQQAGQRDIGQLAEAVQRVGQGVPDGPDVGAQRTEQRAGQAQSPGGDCGQRAAGSGAGPGRGQRAQIGGRFAADESDGHGQDGQRQRDAQDGGPGKDLRRGGGAGLGLDRHAFGGGGLPRGGDSRRRRPGGARWARG